MKAIMRLLYRTVFGPVCWRRGHEWRARWEPLVIGQTQRAEVWWCVRCKKRKWPA